MKHPVFDPILALKVLNEHRVAYLLIGSLAGEVLGAAIGTNDIDICHERAPANMERLARALGQLHARPRLARVGDDVDLPFLLDARAIAAGDSFTFVTDAGDLDMVGTPSGTRGYTDLTARAEAWDLGEGLRVWVVSLDDLIRMKEAAGRDKDEAHLHVLTALKRRQS